MHQAGVRIVTVSSERELHDARFKYRLSVERWCVPNEGRIDAVRHHVCMLLKRELKQVQFVARFVEGTVIFSVGLVNEG